MNKSLAKILDYLKNCGGSNQDGSTNFTIADHHYSDGLIKDVKVLTSKIY